MAMAGKRMEQSAEAEARHSGEEEGPENEGVFPRDRARQLGAIQEASKPPWDVL